MKHCLDCKRIISSESNFCKCCNSNRIEELEVPRLIKQEHKDIKIFVNEILIRDKKFFIKRPIGLGGKGMVIEVEDENGKRLAMKVPLEFKDELTSIGLPFSFGKNIGLEFEKEETIMKKPVDRIIKIFEAGYGLCIYNDMEKKFPIITMELAECTLLDLVLMEADGKIEISKKEKYEIIKQLLEAIKEFHEAGIVHRDISLENIFVVERNNKIKYVLADFGTAKTKDDPINTKSRLVVNPRYLDPYRLNKKFERDPRLDLFSLGIIITEILIGDVWNNIIDEDLEEGFDFEKEFLQTYGRKFLSNNIVEYLSKAVIRNILDRYNSAHEMEDEFHSAISDKKRRKVKYVATIHVQYEIKFPNRLKEGIENLDVLQHKRIKIGALPYEFNLHFKDVEINKIITKHMYLFDIEKFDSIENTTLKFSVKEKRFEKLFKVIGEKDKGTLYFEGELNVSGEKYLEEN